MAYRPGEVAKRLDIAPVTLRVWSNEFAAFLGDSAQRTVNADGKANHRIYSDSDITVLKRAGELLASGQTFDQVRRALAEAGPPPVSIQTLEEIPRMLAQLQSSYNRELSAKEETISEQRSHIETLREENERKQAEIERQQAEIERLRSRPLWDRLRNK
jgi:DNA-binding transcriptional MerR regulator